MGFLPSDAGPESILNSLQRVRQGDLVLVRKSPKDPCHPVPEGYLMGAIGYAAKGGVAIVRKHDYRPPFVFPWKMFYDVVYHTNGDPEKWRVASVEPPRDYKPTRLTDKDRLYAGDSIVRRVGSQEYGEFMLLAGRT